VPHPRRKYYNEGCLRQGLRGQESDAGVIKVCSEEMGGTCSTNGLSEIHKQKCALVNFTGRSV
jgi:hypothetical protein